MLPTIAVVIGSNASSAQVGTHVAQRAAYAANMIPSGNASGSFATIPGTPGAPVGNSTSAGTSSAPGGPTMQPIPPTPPTRTTNPTDSPQRKLVFDDEFDGTALNTSDWTVRDGTYLGYDKAYISAQNVTVSGGALTIAAKPTTVNAYGKTFPYTTGYLDSIHHFSQKYGRWVMRAKLPQVEGMWPAFWLRSDHGTGEIDIMEAVGGMPQMAQQTLIQDTNSGKVKTVTVTDLPKTTTTADWHEYGFTWSPTQMTWDIDGTVVKTVRSTDVSWYGSTFNDTVNIRLNLQVGGTMPAYFGHDLKSTTRAASDYVIDYVRVYAA